MITLTAPRAMTAEEFLAWEIAQREKHEFVDGRIVAMAGASRAHQMIALNTALALRARLRGGPCMALHEQKILTPRGNWRYADVAVDCGPRAMTDLAATEPRLVVEVESPSTSMIEELERLEDYQSVPSVSLVLVVAQSRARARLYLRDGANWRQLDAAGLDESIELASLGVTLPMAEIYEGVEFG